MNFKFSSLFESTSSNFSAIRDKIPLDNTQLMIVGISLFIVIIIIIIVLIIRKNRKNLENPVFYRNKKDSKIAGTIPQKLIYEPKNGYDFTWSFWIYIDDWNYKLGHGHKHVFTKGRLEWNPKNASPAIFLGSRINDMEFYITSTTGVEKFILKDIPIKKWTHISLILKTKEIDLYIDGKLSKSNVLNGLPKLNHGNLYVNHFGGFSGKISSIAYSPEALNPKYIRADFYKGPARETLVDKVINKVKNTSNKIIGIEPSDSSQSSGGSHSSGCNVQIQKPKPYKPKKCSGFTWNNRNKQPCVLYKKWYGSSYPNNSKSTDTYKRNSDNTYSIIRNKYPNGEWKSLETNTSEGDAYKIKNNIDGLQECRKLCNKMKRD